MSVAESSPADAPPIGGTPLDPAEAATAAREHRKKIFAFLALMTAMFMSMLDNQIVSTALPTIVGEFGHLERFGWVGSAYLLASSSVMPLYGKLGDLFGRKQVLMSAVVLFLIGSAACGLASSMNQLIGFRVLQALGGGGIAVSIFSINADLFGPRERARYQSYSSLVLMMAGAIGPVLGGTMSHWLGWRSIFLINLPIGAVVLVALGVLLRRRRPDRVPKIDFAGAILLAATIASVVLWADGSELFGGLLSVGGLTTLGFGLVCLCAWIWLEKRVVEPVVPLSIFRNPTVSLLLWVSLASGAVGIGMSNYFALYLQSGVGLSPSMAGLMFIPLTGGIALGSINAGRIISRTGRYKPFAVASTATTSLSLVAIAFAGPSVPLAVMCLLFLIQGIGVGIGQQVPVLGVQNAALARDVGAATGTVTLTRMGGASVGISIYGAILSAGVSAAAAAATLPAGINVTKLEPAVVATLSPEVRATIAGVYASASFPLFLTAAGVAATGLLAALMLKNVQLPTKRH